MQPPLQLAAAVATVEASLWVRNGQCMSEQVLNYHSPPLCRHMSDLDLLVLQLGASQACHVLGFGTRLVLARARARARALTPTLA